eukprot:231399-Pyramimonas_sp.AAC.1
MARSSVGFPLRRVETISETRVGLDDPLCPSLWLGVDSRSVTSGGLTGCNHGWLVRPSRNLPD